jgi:alkylhydroperoxidase family enzyme
MAGHHRAPRRGRATRADLRGDGQPADAGPYQPPHDDAPGIIRAHSLDPELMRRTFAISAALHQSTLDWADRELISSVTSRTNQCFY